MAVPAKLLLVEDAVLFSMAGNPNFVREFPFLSGLKSLSKAKPGCNTCGRAASQRVSLINGIKSTLVSLGAERKQRLKKMLNTQQVRIRLAQGGRVMVYTF